MASVPALIGWTLGGYIWRVRNWFSSPVEGADWTKGPYFGQPVEPGDFQQPRTFRVSLGIRFQDLDVLRFQRPRQSDGGRFWSGETTPGLHMLTII
jgi:hypothetical protein